MYPVNATRRYNPTAVPIDEAITPFISFSSLISFAIVNIFEVNDVLEEKLHFDDK
jgi:hypothetical protein